MNWDRGLKRVRLVVAITVGLIGLILMLPDLKDSLLEYILFALAWVVVFGFGIAWGGVTVIMWVRRGFCEDKQKDGQKTNESDHANGIVETKHPKQKGDDYDN